MPPLPRHLPSGNQWKTAVGDVGDSEKFYFLWPESDQRKPMCSQVDQIFTCLHQLFSQTLAPHRVQGYTVHSIVWVELGICKHNFGLLEAPSDSLVPSLALSRNCHRLTSWTHLFTLRSSWRLSPNPPTSHALPLPRRSSVLTHVSHSTLFSPSLVLLISGGFPSKPPHSPTLVATPWTWSVSGTAPRQKS